MSVQTVLIFAANPSTSDSSDHCMCEEMQAEVTPTVFFPLGAGSQDSRIWQSLG